MKISIKRAVAAVIMAAVPALSALAAAPHGVADTGASELPEPPAIPGSRTFEQYVRDARSPFNADRKAAERAWIDSIGSAPTDPPAGDVPQVDEADINAIINGAFGGR